MRDEKPFHQFAGIKKIEGTYKYIFGTNAGNLGIAHFLNEKGYVENAGYKRGIILILVDQQNTLPMELL